MKLSICLGIYNEKKDFLEDRWVEVQEQNLEEIIDSYGEERGLLPGETIQIEDSYGFYPYDIYEKSISEIQEVIDAVADYGEAYLHFKYGSFTYPEDSTIKDFFVGTYESKKDFVISDIEDEVPEWLLPYIDYDKLGRNLFSQNYWSEENKMGGIYVFRR